jgi:hypothetical protein
MQLDDRQTDRLLASVLIPPGQDAELMGVYLFAGQILTWLPPLVFTVLNEVGVNQRIGVGTLAVYFLIGAVALVLMGSYPAAVSVAGRMHSPIPTDENEDQSAKAKLDLVETEETGHSDRIELQPADNDRGVTVEDSPPKSGVGE